jgi:N-acetylneuraminic acid mutarotase
MFGIAVAVNGSTVAVSSRDSMGVNDKVNVYQLLGNSNTWYETVVVPTVSSSLYGASVDISSSKLVVGAPYSNNANGVSAGQVYVYDILTVVGETKLYASDSLDGEGFGRSVDLHGNTLVVGAPGRDVVEAEEGAVYVYQYDPSSSSWAETMITEVVPDKWGGFGSKVAVYGNTIAVAKSYSEEVFLYQHDPSSDSWHLTILTPGDGWGQFGTSFDLHGNTLVVGAVGEGVSFNSSLVQGAAYIYQYDSSTDSWHEIRIQASDEWSECSPGGCWGGQFGQSVSVHGNSVLVGRPHVDNYRGAAYLYQYDPSSDVWHETKITASDGAGSAGFPGPPGHKFGFSVDMYGDIMAVGAIEQNSSYGAIYVYQWDPSSNSWHEDKLTSTESLGLGGGVSVYGKNILSGNTQKELAHIFRYNPSTSSWSESTFLPSDYTSGSQFGKIWGSQSIAIDANHIAIGALGDDESSLNAGAVYLFNLDLLD